MIIPPERLSPDILSRLLEEFIMREGTDYGEMEMSLEVKVEQLKRQLVRKEVLIVFDAASETTNLMTPDDYASLSLPDE